MPSMDALKIGWTIVAIMLVFSGIHDIMVPEIYGRVRLPESEPLLKGASVVLLGIAELGLGIFLLYRQWFRRQA
jgi:uncharacterized membrane protein